MKESKRRIAICSLCLLVSLSAPAFAQQKLQTQPEQSLSKTEIKARAAETRRAQLNQDLFAAIDAQVAGTVLKKLASGADVNARDREGMTPLMHAALSGNPDLNQLLLRKGAAVNPYDGFGVTALMQAAWAGHAQVVEILLAQGADPNFQTVLEFPRLKKAGATALMGASMNGNLEVVKLLLDGNIRVNQQDAEG